MPNLTLKEASAAMFEVLKSRYKQTRSDELGGMLGEMSLLPDGSTADPAIWGDWLKCVEAAKGGKVDLQLHLN